MKMKKTASLYFSVALLSVLAALLLCFLGPTATPLLLWDAGDPVESAEQFLAALNGGDYAAASALCRSPLPAETAPDGEDAAALYALLKESWHGEVSGDARREGDRAFVPVRFSALDPAALTEGLKDDINALLEQYVEEARLASDVFEEDGSYREAVVLRAWKAALNARMERAGDYVSERDMTLTLRYSHRTWQIVPDRELLSALAGGA